jgi:hypothetical protein
MHLPRWLAARSRRHVWQTQREPYLLLSTSLIGCLGLNMLTF